MNKELEQKTPALNRATSQSKAIQFVAGTVLGNRYRIIGLLGEGY